MSNGYPPNFSSPEFNCNCQDRYCDGPSPYPAATRHLAWTLQRIRSALGGKPIHINSGYRCMHWNLKNGGASASYHTKGMAADLDVQGASPKEVADVIENMMKNGEIPDGGLGRYESFTHIDIRSRPARWGSND